MDKAQRTGKPPSGEEALMRAGHHAGRDRRDGRAWARAVVARKMTAEITIP
jgi:hypothetical protein